MHLSNQTLWLLCGGAALALHASAAVLFIGDSQEVVMPIGQKGVLVELAFEGAVAGGRAQTGNTREQTNSQSAEVAPDPKKTEPKNLPVKEPEPTPEKPPEPQPVKPPTEKPKPVSKKPEPKTKPVNSAVKPVTKAKSPPAETITVQNEVGANTGAEATAVTNSIGGAGGKNTQAKGTGGDGNASQSGGMGGIIKSYEDLVQVWVHKHLFYPQSARKRQMIGIVTVRFSLSREGQLLSAEVVEASSYKILNRAALKTIKRAVPFPSFPPEFEAENRTFIIPIEFMVGGR